MTNNKMNKKKIIGISAISLGAVLIIGFGSLYTIGQKSYKDVVIAQVKTTSIKGMINDDAIVAKVNKQQPKLNVVDAVKTGITSVFGGSKAVQDQQSDNEQTKQIMSKVESEVKTEHANQSQTDSAEDDKTKAQANEKTDLVKDAEKAVETKKTANDVKSEMKKQNAQVTDEEAEKIANEANLANIIQLNAQNKYPNDILAISSKLKDGTYNLANISTGESYILTVSTSGDIIKMEKIK